MDDARKSVPLGLLDAMLFCLAVWLVAVILRYLALKRPLAKKVAIGVAARIWIAGLIAATAMGLGAVGVHVAAIFSYYTLIRT